MMPFPLSGWFVPSSLVVKEFAGLLVVVGVATAPLGFEAPEPRARSMALEPLSGFVGVDEPVDGLVGGLVAEPGVEGVAAVVGLVATGMFDAAVWLGFFEPPAGLSVRAASRILEGPVSELSDLPFTGAEPAVVVLGFFGPVFVVGGVVTGLAGWLLVTFGGTLFTPGVLEGLLGNGLATFFGGFPEPWFGSPIRLVFGDPELDAVGARGGCGLAWGVEGAFLPPSPDPRGAEEGLEREPPELLVAERFMDGAEDRPPPPMPPEPRGA